MASDSSRPGTSNGGGRPLSMSSVNTTTTTGIRGIRASKSAASESWDDDFLWQHSSSSDLHLPSTASRHHYHQRQQLPSHHQHHRDKRLSTASSSSEYYAPSTRLPLRAHRKSSALSTSTMSSTTTDDAGPSSSSPVDNAPPRNTLSRSASSSYSQAPSASSSSGRHHKNWASLSQTSLQEHHEEDEPTITLATIAARSVHAPPSLISVPMSRTTTGTGTNGTSHSSTSPLRCPYSTASPASNGLHQEKGQFGKLVPPTESFFRTVSTSSWRSTTPSLASDTWSTAAHTDDNATTSATETDNETALEEGEQGEGGKNTSQEVTRSNSDDTWEQLNLSPEGAILANGAGGGGHGGSLFGHSQNGSSSRRKRGRGNTLGTSTPRMALSALFGNVANATVKEKEASEAGTPSKRLGLFRRSSRMKKDAKSPVSPVAILQEASTISAAGRKSEEPRSRSRSPVSAPLSGQQTPTLPHRELRPEAQKEDKTVRARQSTGASSTTSNTLFFSSSPQATTRLTHDRLHVSRNDEPSTSLGRQASFERTPKASDGSSNNDRSKALSRISYNSTLSDRLRFEDGTGLDASRQGVRETARNSPRWQVASDAEDAGADADRSQEGYVASIAQGSQYLSPHPTMEQQQQLLGTSTTSLVSNQSSATYTSTFSNDSQPQMSRQESMPSRRKLKKIRPTSSHQTPASPIIKRTSMLFRPRTADGPPTTPQASEKSPLQSGLSLSPGFAFPPPVSPRQTGINASPRMGKSPAVSLAEQNGSTSETASASSSRRKPKTKSSGIASSLRRRVSKRRTPNGAAEESSADEDDFVNTRRGSLDKIPVNSATLRIPKGEDRPFHSNSSVKTWKPGHGSHVTSIRPKTSISVREGERMHSTHLRPKTAEPELPSTAATSGSMRGTRLLAGLSKRMSIDFKNSRTPQQGLEKRRSIVFARSERPQSVLMSPDSEVSASTPTTLEPLRGSTGSSRVPNADETPPATVTKKHKRPLSLSGFLSRSTGPFDTSRTRASSTASTQSPLSLSTNDMLGRSVPSAPASASLVGGFRRPSGFMHRSTASSGNIPTAKALLGGPALQTASLGLLNDRRTSLDLSARSPPHVLHRQRSFNPLWRSTTATVPEERPPWSLSLLSETSTVRPLSMLPTASSTATIMPLRSENGGEGTLASKMDSPPTKLRQRHLPSLSLTLVPGPVTSTPPRSTTPSFPSLSPRVMQRAHSENPYGTAHSSLRSHYFTAADSSNGGSTPTSKNTSLACSPGAVSRGSDDSDGSVNLVRRVSLSDLKIPQRISNAQAKIGQDLKRVKEFKEGVEELKRLRKIYRGLVNSVSPTLLSDPINQASPSIDERAEASPSPPPLPSDTSTRVDNLMSRVALDYSRWWEIADVLINLADGAEEEEAEKEAGKRERCKSEITVGTNSPPKESRGLRDQLQLQPQIEPHAKVVKLDTGSTRAELSDSNGVNENAAKSIQSVSESAGASSPRLLSTPIQRKTPHLTRSFSTSSLSPPSASASRSPPKGDVPHSIASAHHHAASHPLGDQSLSLSERQLHILRGMLKPPSTPTMSPASRSVDSSPARTPSVTSLSPRSHPFLNGLVPLSPFTASRERPSTASSSSFTGLKRRTSIKSGHVIITSLPPDDEISNDSRSLLSPRTEEMRSISPIPDSPPFHISNMLPTPPEHTGQSTPTGTSYPFSAARRISISRSPSGKTNISASISNSNSAEASMGKSPPSTPLMRRGRLRQASRAGMLGLRDFLKGFNARKNTLEADTSVEADEDSKEDFQQEQGETKEAAIEKSTDENKALLDEHVPLVEEDQRICASPLREEGTPVKHTSRESNGSSEEEEDWDRHSSEEEEQDIARHLPRSDTQATVMPNPPHEDDQAQCPGQLSTSQNIQTDAGSVTPVRNGKSSNTRVSMLRERTSSTHSSSTTGTTVQYASVPPSLLGNVNVNSSSMHDQRPKTSPAEQSRSRTQQQERQPNPAPNGGNLRRSTGTTDNLLLPANMNTNTKLAMTSEAMPVLLAKIREVKEHCSTCVTELRNVTV